MKIFKNNIGLKSVPVLLHNDEILKKIGMIPDEILKKIGKSLTNASLNGIMSMYILYVLDTFYHIISIMW